jgi:SAM-dependent methyltransferase
MLTDPDHFALCPYNRNRLVVEHMDALDLRFDDETFDAVYSLSSIEHFGGYSGARQALMETRRVLKRGGVAAITTECIVNDADGFSEPGLSLFTPRDLHDLFWSVPGLVPVEGPVFSLSERTQSLAPIPLLKAVEDAQRGHVDYPCIVLELAGRVYTSFSVFLRRDDHQS